LPQVYLIGLIIVSDYLLEIWRINPAEQDFSPSARTATSEREIEANTGLKEQVSSPIQDFNQQVRLKRGSSQTDVIPISTTILTIQQQRELVDEKYQKFLTQLQKQRALLSPEQQKIYDRVWW
jgi:hypothetical protein